MINNCSNTTGQEGDSHSIAYGEDTHDADTGKLSFTSEQHKALLALLQNSNTLPSHSVNHMTTNSPLGTSIICTIPTLIKLETFILDTGANDHVCYSRKKIQCLTRVNPIKIKLPNGSIILCQPV